MKKENILFSVIGLLAGLIIGFIVTNSYNRSALQTQNLQVPPNMQVPNQQNNIPTAAMPEVDEALKKAESEPDNFEAQTKVGEMFFGIRNFERSLSYFEKANKIKPDHYQTIVSLGNVNFELSRFEEAQKWYEKALETNKEDVNVRTDLGLTFFVREPKDIDRAIKEYKTSLEINPKHEGTLQNLAVAYREKKDTEGLKETLEKLEKVNPNNKIIQRLKEPLPN